jgi:hypothetical protein
MTEIQVIWFYAVCWAFFGILTVVIVRMARPVRPRFRCIRCGRNELSVRDMGCGLPERRSACPMEFIG